MQVGVFQPFNSWNSENRKRIPIGTFFFPLSEQFFFFIKEIGLPLLSPFFYLLSPLPSLD
jgi:hypothetical protein